MMSHFRWSGIASRVNLALALSAVPLIALSPACGSTAPQPGSVDPMESPLATASPSRIRIYPWKDPRQISERPRVAAASAHLTYYGGKVISNVKVVVVDWGPNTNSTVKSGIGGFYGAVTNSSYFDWLSEYDTKVRLTPQIRVAGKQLAQSRYGFTLGADFRIQCFPAGRNGDVHKCKMCGMLLGQRSGILRCT